MLSAVTATLSLPLSAPLPTMGYHRVRRLIRRALSMRATRLGRMVRASLLFIVLAYTAGLNLPRRSQAGTAPRGSVVPLSLCLLVTALVSFARTAPSLANTYPERAKTSRRRSLVCQQQRG